MRTHTLIKLKLCTHKALIKAYFHTNFGQNLMKIYRFIDFSCKKVEGLSRLERLKACYIIGNC